MDDIMCWCGHCKSAHDAEGICRSCVPRTDGGATSQEHADRINAESVQRGGSPYASFIESWCMKFKPEEEVAVLRKAKADQRERDGVDMMNVLGNAAFEDWWRAEGRAYAKRCSGPDWFNEKTRTAFKSVAYKSWLQGKGWETPVETTGTPGSS